MPKIGLNAIPATNQSGFPPQYTDVLQGRWYRRIGRAAGLSDFGVTHVRLEPGAWSSQRHWHANHDEFVVIVVGDVVLIDDDGEHPMTAGDCAAFPQGDGNGHCLVNRGAMAGAFSRHRCPPLCRWHQAPQRRQRFPASEFGANQYSLMRCMRCRTSRPWTLR
jgi:uncharacterized cupin superfamily protein